MYLFYILLRYLKLKGNTKVTHVKVLHILSGRASPTSKHGNSLLEFIFKVAHIINNDPSAESFMKIVFIPNFNVRVAEILVSSADSS